MRHLPSPVSMTVWRIAFRNTLIILGICCILTGQFGGLVVLAVLYVLMARFL
jgi:hypothetical protein